MDFICFVFFKERRTTEWNFKQKKILKSTGHERFTMSKNENGWVGLKHWLLPDDFVSVVIGSFSGWFFQTEVMNRSWIASKSQKYYFCVEIGKITSNTFFLNSDI